MDLGGVPYLVPTVQRDRLYDLKLLPNLVGMSDGPVSMIGAGAGPWPHLRTNCEMMTNILFGESNTVNSTRLATVNETGTRQLHGVPPNQTGCALLNNLLVTRGETSSVLHVKCEKRTGTSNFVSGLRQILQERYPNRVIGN